VERLYGPLRFAAIYVIAAVAGDLLSVGLSNSISAGASGAIFGLLGATISLTLRRGGAFPGGLRDALLRNAVAVVAINAVISFTVPGINLFAHGGGFLAGAATGALLRPRPAFARRPQGPLGAALGIAAMAACLLALIAALVWGFGGA
jgi:rhomboid protease GluP